MLFEKHDIFDYDPDHPHCHCSVIQELPNGELMAVWYAGKAEAHKSVAIKASWKPLKEDKWSAPKVIHKTPNKADGNEIIIYYQNKLHLFFNTIHGFLFPWSKTIVKHKVSTDFGRTWSEPKILVKQKGYTFRTKPLVLDNGNKLVIPVGRETIRKAWAQMMIFEGDNEEFHFSEEIRVPDKHWHQPAICKLNDGKLLAFLRTHENYIYKTTSNDDGEHWQTPVPTELYNPDSALDFVHTEKGELILIWNNNPRQGGIMKSRKVLHVGYSPDEGKSWPIIKELERDDENGRFAYPAIIQGSDGLFHVTYTNRRKTIRYVKFDLEWLKS